MPLTQEQVIDIISAGQTIYKSIETQNRTFDDFITYELQQTYDRIAALDPSDEIKAQLQSLHDAITELRTGCNHQLYSIHKEYMTLAHWADHYKQRRKSNISSREWQQRKRGKQPAPEHDNNHNNNYDLQIIHAWVDDPDLSPEQNAANRADGEQQLRDQGYIEQPDGTWRLDQQIPENP